MDRPRVYVTRLIPDSAIRRLSEDYDVEVNTEDRPLTYEELLGKVQGRDAVLSMLTDTIDARVFDAAGPRCRIFANYAVGYNNIDVQAATMRGIFVTNTPDVLTASTADMAWALIFTVARRVAEGDRVTRAGAFKGWSPLFMLGLEVSGKTLGIVGAGRIGQAVAHRAAGFSMKILYTATTQKHKFEEQTGAQFVDLDTILQESDFISLHMPLSPATHHMIGPREFGLMKRSAILINTARGPVVDEDALVAALREKVIWGAGLDVYEKEPELHPGLSSLDNVVLAPHLGSATLETRTEMGVLATQNIIDALEGAIPPNCLNPDAKRVRMIKRLP